MPSGNGMSWPIWETGWYVSSANFNRVGPINQKTTITAAADMNGDGHVDLVVALGSTSFNYIYGCWATAPDFYCSKFIGDTATGNATIADVNSDGIPDILSAGGFVFIERVTGPLAQISNTTLRLVIYADFERRIRCQPHAPVGVNTLTFFHINPDGSFNLTNPLGSVSFPAVFQFTSVLQALT